MSPVARRTSRHRWRDPRLLVGVLVVAVSVLSGTRLLASADDTVEVWALRDDLSAGTPVATRHLEPQEVRFVSASLAARYVPSGHPVPTGTVLARDVAAGELLPRDSLTERAAGEHVEVPLAAATDAVPATLRVGETVDVWVTRPDQEDEPEALLVLEGVRVVAVPRDGNALGPASMRQVVVSVPDAEDSGLGAALGQLSTGTAVVVRRG